MMWTDKERDHELGVLRRILVETKGLSRREFIERLGAAAAGSAVLGALGSTLAGRVEAQGHPVTTIGWGGAWQDACYKAYFDPFTKKTGIPVKYVAPYDFAKVRAMHQAGRMELDAIEPGGLDTPRAIKLGMCQPLNWKVIDKSALTPNQLKYGDMGVGSITLSTVLAYNKKKWPGAEHPKSWADFWDVKKYPGPRALQRRVYPNLEYAIMADGVPADTKKVYPLDVERAFK